MIAVPMTETTDPTTVTIRNKLGMHARPAMLFVESACTFESDIKVSRADQGEQCSGSHARSCDLRTPQGGSGEAGEHVVGSTDEGNHQPADAGQRRGRRLEAPECQDSREGPGEGGGGERQKRESSAEHEKQSRDEKMRDSRPIRVADRLGGSRAIGL